MAIRLLTTLMVTGGLMLGGLAGPARADNPMGYRLLSAQDAAGLPHNQGALGLDVERAQRITDSGSGMTFELMRVKRVRPGSAGAQAGLRVGDQIIAVDGQVFPTIAAFAAYIGSVAPGTQAMVDYIPGGGGPGQAQRIGVVVGAAGRPSSSAPAPASPDKTTSAGMSTGTKVAIGAAAAALFGCYKLGCFSHRGSSGATTSTYPTQQDQPMQQGSQPSR